MNLNEAFASGKIVVPENIKSGQLTADVYGLEFGSVLRKVDAYYSYPEKFFEKTFLSKNMIDVYRSVLQKVTNNNGYPVMNIDTTFGGGKTHLLVGLYHLLTNPQDSIKSSEINKLFKDLKIESNELSDVKVVALDGHDIDDEKETLWGKISHILNFPKTQEYHKKKSALTSSQIKELLEFPKAPIVILMDELVVYLKKLRSNEKMLDQVSTFLHSLCSSINEVEKCTIILTFTEREAAYEAEYIKISETLSDIFSTANRSGWVISPLQGNEIYDVVRKQLFESVDVQSAKSTANKLSAYYDLNKDYFPEEVTSIEYKETIEKSYPFHPDLIKILYERISTIPNFQRARGVLRVLSLSLQYIWINRSHLSNFDIITAAAFDLRGGSLRSELTNKLDLAVYNQVIQSDITNEDGTGKAQQLDNLTFGGSNQNIISTIYLGSLIGSKNEAALGFPQMQIAVHCCGPDTPIQPNDLPQYIQQGLEQLWYLYERNKHYFFQTKPNINKAIMERSRQIEYPRTLPLFRDIVRKYYEGLWFDVRIMNEDGMDEFKTEKPLLLISPLKIGTEGKNIPDVVVDTFQHVRGGGYRSRRNFLFALIPTSQRVDSYIDKLKQLVAVNEMISSKAFPEESKDLILRQKELLAQSNRLEVVYEWIAYPDSSEETTNNVNMIQFNLDPDKIDSDEKKYFAQRRILSALKQASKLIFEIDGEDINYYYLKDEIKQVNNVFSIMTEGPTLPLLMNDSIKNNNVKKLLFDTILTQVKNGQLGVLVGTLLDIDSINNNNYKSIKNGFSFGVVGLEHCPNELTGSEYVLPQAKAILYHQKIKEIEDSLDPPIPGGNGGDPDPIPGPSVPSQQKISTPEEFAGLPDEFVLKSISLIFSSLSVSDLNSVLQELRIFKLSWRPDTWSGEINIAPFYSAEIRGVDFDQFSTILNLQEQVLSNFSSIAQLKVNSSTMGSIDKIHKDDLENLIKKDPSSFEFNIEA